MATQNIIFTVVVQSRRIIDLTFLTKKFSPLLSVRISIFTRLSFNAIFFWGGGGGIVAGVAIIPPATPNP